MTPQQAYQRQAVHSWTRIDLLLALYDASIEALSAGAEAARRQDEAALLKHRARVQRLMVEILDGLDPRFPETTDRIRQLALFVLSCVAGGDPGKWESSARVFTTLREGYADVREDAVQFEQQQELPAAADRPALSELL